MRRTGSNALVPRKLLERESGIPEQTGKVIGKKLKVTDRGIGVNGHCFALLQLALSLGRCQQCYGTCHTILSQ